ncbi:hypothetical protein X975_08745, partial [Stegodyphus mimosarum]
MKLSLSETACTYTWKLAEKHLIYITLHNHTQRQN